MTQKRELYVRIKKENCMPLKCGYGEEWKNSWIQKMRNEEVLKRVDKRRTRGR